MVLLFSTCGVLFFVISLYIIEFHTDEIDLDNLKDDSDDECAILASVLSYTGLILLVISLFISILEQV